MQNSARTFHWRGFGAAMRRLLAIQRNSLKDNSFAGEFSAVDALLQRAGVRDGYVVDVAASDGVTQSTTLPLFQRGWHGLAVEMDPELFRGLAFVYAGFENARLARTRVTPDNVAALLGANEVPAEFDFLNLDIDSYDLHVLAALLKAGYRPKVVSMEINEKIPPPIWFSVDFSEDHYWRGDHFYGCSLTAAGETLRPQGYLLASVEYNNALFVAAEHAAGVVDAGDAAAYRAGYVDRPDRKALFPWNADMEPLLTMAPEDAVEAVTARFASYAGKFVARVQANGSDPRGQ